MFLRKPATVIRWHQNGFRRSWRWRSGSRCPGRPRVDRAVRDLIRQISRANPLWGAPRIHGEIGKLGIVVSQATVARCMLRRKAPSPTWRAFLRNHFAGIAAIDMFVVATATFQLLYALVVLGHDRRKIIHIAVTQHPAADWLARQITEAFPWDSVPRYLLRDRDAELADLTMDPGCAPERIGPADLADQVAHHTIDTWAAGPAGSGPPAPVGAETVPMPPDDRCRLDEDDGAQAARP